MLTANNPILPGFYPDPSICRAGEDFYIVNSSFAYFPGVPIFHSKNLAYWEQIGHVLDREEQLPLTESEISRGIFAPTIRYHQGQFYMITTNINHGGNFIVTAKDPRGPWSDPYYLGAAAPGIDPSLFFDEDGRCYYVGTRPNPDGVRYNGDWEIWLQELDLASMQLTGDSKSIWKGALKDAIWPEGPHLYKKDGYYYLLIAEGGTGPEHAVSVARSKSLWSWFEGCPRNPIFTHRHLGADYPVTYAGHGDLVEDGKGNWFIVMLASRPHQRHCSLGRETFLAEVNWEAGWPVINAGGGKLTKTVNLPFDGKRSGAEITHTDIIHFHQKQLDQRLVSIQQRQEHTWSLTERPGFLRLYLGQETLHGYGAPAYFGIRQKDYSCHVSTALDFHPQKEGESAGLVLYHNQENHLKLEVRGDAHQRELVLTARIKGSEVVAAKQQLCCEGMVELHMEAAGQQAVFYSIDILGLRTVVAEAVSLLPYTTEAAGGFVGCTIGMYASANGRASGNFSDFAWITYEGKGEG